MEKWERRTMGTRGTLRGRRVAASWAPRVKGPGGEKQTPRQPPGRRKDVLTTAASEQGAVGCKRERRRRSVGERLVGHAAARRGRRGAASQARGPARVPGHRVPEAGTDNQEAEGAGLPLPLRLPMGLGLVLRWDREAPGSGPLTPEAAAREI